jgi:hypothetical protein
MTPLVWNTLQEAAAYLTESTGKIWTKNEVLSAAIEYPISIHRNLTFIQVAMPRDTRFGVYVFDMDIGGLNPFRRKAQFVWIPIRLRQFQVRDLLIHGEVQISSAGDSEAVDGLSEGDCVFIEPLGSKHIVNLDMLGIRRIDLKELVSKIKTGARSSLDPPQRETATPKELATLQKHDASLAENKQPLTEISDVSQVGYTTKEMEIQKIAIAKFWQNHDPARPPKKPEIVAWLREQGISKRTAISMDSVMRPLVTRNGGNKRVTPLKTSK